MRYKLGHVDPWWDDNFKTLDYKYIPIKNTHDEQRWKNEGYKNVTLNGALYNMSNPMPEYATPFFTLFDWLEIGGYVDPPIPLIPWKWSTWWAYLGYSWCEFEWCLLLRRMSVFSFFCSKRFGLIINMNRWEWVSMSLMNAFFSQWITEIHSVHV